MVLRTHYASHKANDLDLWICETRNESVALHYKDLRTFLELFRVNSFMENILFISCETFP